ncbi:MAG: hypothetical protein NTX00_05720, partial [Candidatus Parcubacteria bacterium]|nr:hypothetical protein [Candidatus Parcubacteria bacterium]
MKKRVLLKKILLTLLIGAGLFFITSSVSAQIQPGLNEIASPLGLGTQDIRVTIANIIRVALGLLGIVAVVIIIYGGVLYLTSMGEPEKIKKAKDLLIAAIIGLVIILTSFAIASFIISSILNATGVGPGVNGVIIPTCEETGTCPPPPWPGCADPDTTSIHKNAPFICNLDPKHGPKGQFVTIQGGKFGSYLATYTKVFFRQGSTDYEATVALCNGQPSWNDNQIVVEVPNNLPFNVSGSNNFKVVVKIEGYDSSEKSTGGFPPNDQFTLDEGQPGPGIACIVPDSGKENTAVNVFGKRFGATQDFSTLRFFGSIDATVTTWADELLNSSVPVGAKRGNVYVRVNGRESNGYGFIVTCEQDTDCGSGCCFDGYFGKECADLNYCLPGPNQSCDTDINASGCQAGDCQTGLFCDVTKGCTCQPAGPGTPCDRDPLTPSCELDNNKCGQGLYCSVHATLSCTCQYLPRIDDVQPRDGAPGNFITLWGRGFGSSFNPSRTKVIFLGDTTDPTDDKDGIFP